MCSECLNKIVKTQNKLLDLPSMKKPLLLDFPAKIKRCKTKIQQIKDLKCNILHFKTEINKLNDNCNSSSNIKNFVLSEINKYEESLGTKKLIQWNYKTI